MRVAIAFDTLNRSLFVIARLLTDAAGMNRVCIKVELSL
jgi:hypothetical protein